MSDHAKELVRRLRDSQDNGYIGEAGQTVRCSAASYIEALTPVVDKYLAAAIARPADDYHEDIGDVVWWTFPVEEPPYVGGPNDTDWPGYHTHWTPLIIPEMPER